MSAGSCQAKWMCVVYFSNEHNKKKNNVFPFVLILKNAIFDNECLIIG